MNADQLSKPGVGATEWEVNANTRAQDIYFFEQNIRERRSLTCLGLHFKFVKHTYYEVKNNCGWATETVVLTFCQVLRTRPQCYVWGNIQV